MSEGLRNRIKAVFFDIDETLYDKHTDILAPQVEKAFTRLKQRGIVPAIATGRARYIFPKSLNAVIERTGVEHFVTINGQLNLHRQQLVSDYPIERQEVVHLTEYFLGRQIPVGYAGRSTMALAVDDARFNDALTPITREVPIELNPDYALTESVYQMLVGYGEDQQASVDASGILDGGRFKTVRWHEFAVDLLYAAGSKIRGIHDVAQGLGLTLDQVMVFGDSLNDIEMLSEAGFGVAMGNGHPEARKHADYIAGHQKDDGVYHALVDLGIIDGD